MAQHQTQTGPGLPGVRLMPARLRLPAAVLDQLLTLAAQSPAEEVCALLAQGAAGISLYPVANIADDKSCRFTMDPQAQIDAMRLMRDRDETLLAIFHSHPASPAMPSATDLAEHGYPEALALILTLQDPDSPELRAFRMQAGQAEEIPVTV